MTSTTDISFPSGPGPLKVDGVALGDSRADVEVQLGTHATFANPTWARFRLPETSAETVICFQPAWPARELADWRVQTICGSTLSQGGELLLKVGEHVSMVRAALGYVEPEASVEPGFRTMRFGSCLVVLDRGWRVAEISLSNYGMLTCGDSGEQATALLDGSLAC